MTRTTNIALLMLALSSGVGPALAGGVRPGTLTHQRCGAGVCTVAVTYGAAASAGNGCGIRVPDIVFVGRQSTRVEWTLKPAAGSAPALHRFLAGKRIEVDDNTGKSNEPGVPDLAGKVFDDEAYAAAVDAKTLNATGRGRMKAFTYTIHLERAKAGGGFELCDAYDPLIINRD